jgi:type II secretory pathway predicted ATPase ExeA
MRAAFPSQQARRLSFSMYEAFYGLNTDPFRLSADHRFCFNHPSYVRAKGSVQYALYRAEGFVMITGRPGTGKTTLASDLVANLSPDKYVIGHLVSSQVEGGDLLRMAAYAFGLGVQEPQKAHLLMQLMAFLADIHERGMRSVLIIDEAQGLAPSALHELRRLSDLQHESHPLLQIVLLGQNRLRQMVRTPEMEPIHRRLVAAWHLEPLGPEDTISYVRHRLEQAGWRGNPGFGPRRAAGRLPVQRGHPPAHQPDLQPPDALRVPRREPHHHGGGRPGGDAGTRRCRADPAGRQRRTDVPATRAESRRTARSPRVRVMALFRAWEGC